MKRIGIAMAAIAACFLAGVTHANGPVVVDIPESGIEWTKIAHEPSQPAYLSLGASSWQPSSFSLPARFGSDVRFERSGLPQANVAYATSLLSGLSLRASFGFLALARTAVADSQGDLATQEADLFSLGLGVEFTPSALLGSFFEPFASVSLLPSLAATGSTEFDDGHAYFGVPVQFRLGTRLALKKMGWENGAFEFAGVGTVGSVDHSSVAGWGLDGGIRVAL